MIKIAKIVIPKPKIAQLTMKSAIAGIFHMPLPYHSIMKAQ